MGISDLQVKKTLDYRLGNMFLLGLKPCARLLGKILRRDHEPRVRGTVVFLKLLGGGSLVNAFPSILGLRRRYPDVPFHLVTTRGVASFADLLGVFDRVHVLPEDGWPTFFSGALKTLFSCFRVDTVVDLEVYSRLSTTFALLTGARNRLGFYLNDLFWRRDVSTHLIYFNRFGPAPHFYDQIAWKLGAAPAPWDDAERHIRKNLPPLAPADKSDFVLGHGCSGLSLERKLSSGQWADFLVKRISPTPNARLTFLGTAADKSEADEIIQKVAPRLPDMTFRNACGDLTLSESVALIGEAKMFFGIDSGLLHLARLLGTPSVSFWGPTSPAALLRPRSGYREEVKYAGIFCSPCIHVAETAPCGGNNVCMKVLFSSAPLPTGEDSLFTAWPR